MKAINPDLSAAALVSDGLAAASLGAAYRPAGYRAALLATASDLTLAACWLWTRGRSDG